MEWIFCVENMDDAEREAFVAGWEAAGGYMADADSRAPWCAPWEYEDWVMLTLPDDCPEDCVWYEAGRAYWFQMREEIDEEIRRSVINL